MTAVATLQDFLDVTGRAVMQDDFAGFSRHVALPFQLVTDAATLMVADQSDLQAGFDAFMTMLRVHKATDYVRLAESALLLEPSLISGQYVSHMLAGARRIVLPYASTIVLRQDADVWRALSITNTTRNSQWPIVVVDVDDTPSTRHGR